MRGIDSTGDNRWLVTDHDGSALGRFDSRAEAEAVARESLGDGFSTVVRGVDPDGAVAMTPNGRYVLRRPNGRLAAQPHNDNYWVEVDDLAQAKDAYFRR